MPRIILLFLCLLVATPVGIGPALAAPPGPAELQRSIETSRKAIADMERTIRQYDDEMRKQVANDPTSIRRREEIRIIKRYYQQEIEAHKARIIEEYKKIQEFRAGGVQ